MLLALSVISRLIKMRNSGYEFDVIDAHYYFPDGVSAVIVGKFFKKPVVVTARGSDINVLSKFLLPRILIKWAIRNASKNIGVCEDLSKKMIELGAPVESVHTFRNGVDLQLFSPPLDRSALRERLGIKRTTLLFVGRLVTVSYTHLTLPTIYSV